ncbi:MAG: oligosaccharide flippase family protein [Saccharofermentans sp.]|nr:oligosaccharide flippase family protein [Saccharofermentans sp.]
MLDRLLSEINNLIYKLKQGILQVFTANVLNKLIVMISNMVITRVLTKPEYGTWGAVLNVYSYASLITGLGLVSGALQFGAENRGNDKEYSFFKYCASVGLIINGIISIVFILSTYIREYSIPEAVPYIRFFIPIILFEYIVEILLSMMRCDNKMSQYAKALNINTVLIALLTCLGAFWGVGGVVLGKYIAALISTIYIMVINRNELNIIKIAQSISTVDKKELWHYSLFTGLSSCLNRVLYLLDVSMIAELMTDAVEIANYKVATMIPNSLSFIPSSVIIVILPNIIANNKNYLWLKKNIKKTYTTLFLFNVCLGFFLVILAPFIITIISGKQYMDSVSPFRILVIGYVVAGTFRYFSTNLLAAFRRVIFNLIISVATGLADIILNYYWIKSYGIIGAAYATFSVEILASIISFAFVLIELRRRKALYFNNYD